jgi:hypothetical protein
VVRLEYNERDQVGLVIKYIAQFESRSAQWAAFMTREIVGVLDYSSDDPAVHILAYNTRTRKSVDVATDLMRKVRLMLPFAIHFLVFYSYSFVGCC